jgi:hypothetical protein
MVKYWAKAGEINRMRIRLRPRTKKVSTINLNDFVTFFIGLPCCESLLPALL